MGTIVKTTPPVPLLDAEAVADAESVADAVEEESEALAVAEAEALIVIVMAPIWEERADMIIELAWEGGTIVVLEEAPQDEPQEEEPLF